MDVLLCHIHLSTFIVSPFIVVDVSVSFFFSSNFLTMKKKTILCCHCHIRCWYHIVSKSGWWKHWFFSLYLWIIFKSNSILFNVSFTVWLWAISVHRHCCLQQYFFCLEFFFKLSVSKDLILCDASFVCHNLHCSTNALQVIVTEHKNTSKITSFLYEIQYVPWLRMSTILLEWQWVEMGMLGLLIKMVDIMVRDGMFCNIQ